jgi:hypothetical protein
MVRVSAGLLRSLTEDLDSMGEVQRTDGFPQKRRSPGVGVNQQPVRL